MNIDFHNFPDTIQTIQKNPDSWFAYVSQLSPARSAHLLLTEKQASLYGISMRACNVWNQILLRSATWTASYRITDTELTSLLMDLRTELAFKPVAAYSIHSNYTPQTEPFIGREDLLSQIHQAFTEHPVIFLYGIGGIGKSTVARMYAAKYADQYDTLLFTTYRTNLIDLITDDTSLPIEGLYHQSQGKRGEKGRYLRRKLRILQSLLDERTLLIIDNFDTVKDAHYRDLLTLPCRILITTRTQPDVFAGYGVPVSAFNTRTLRKSLFALYAPTIPYSDSLDTVLEAVQGHTLTIKLIAAQLSKSNAIPEELFRNSAAFLQSKDIAEQIRTLFHIANLSREERTILRYLSIMPLEGIPMDTFLQYCHISYSNVVENLIQRHMIEQDTSGILRLHPLIAQVIRDAEKPSFQNCWPYASTLCKLASDAWWMPVSEKLKFQDYIFTLMQYLTTPTERYFEDIIYLVDVCWQFGNFSLAESYAQNLHAYAMKHFGAQHYLTAKLRHSIGTIYHNRGNSEKSGYWFLLAYEDYKDCPNPDLRLYGYLLLKTGRTLRLQKKYEESLTHLLHAADFLISYQDTLETEHRWLVLLDVYLELIALYLDTNQIDRAWEYCLRYQKTHQFYVPDYISNIWHLNYFMGLCQMRMQHYTDAEQYLRRSLDYALTYHGLRIYVMKLLETLGDLSVLMNQQAEAIEWYQKELGALNQYHFSEPEVQSRLRRKIATLTV